MKINRTKKDSSRGNICIADVFKLHVTYRFFCELLWERNSPLPFATWHIVYLILVFLLAVAKSLPSVWRTVWNICLFLSIQNYVGHVFFAPINIWKIILKRTCLPVTVENEKKVPVCLWLLQNNWESLYIFLAVQQTPP